MCAPRVRRSGGDRPFAPVFVPDGASGRALSDRHRGRRPRFPQARAAHRRVDRAGDARQGRRRTQRYRENGRALRRRFTDLINGAATTCSSCRRSFPFGGMENPTLTFLTPTFIAGDKSINSLIAHELAHSWSGNLATNATWSDFWLNEGMTTYATTRIVEAVYGPKVAAQQVCARSSMRCGQAVAENGGPTGARHAPPPRPQGPPSRRRADRYRL